MVLILLSDFILKTFKGTRLKYCKLINTALPVSFFYCSTMLVSTLKNGSAQIGFCDHHRAQILVWYTATKIIKCKYGCLKK